MNKNNEGKNSPKKKDAVNTPKKKIVDRGQEILERAGYKLVRGPYVQAKGDQN